MQSAEKELNSKKVELVYEKLRIEIEGEISSAKIGSLMQILEGE